jgi:hypothetical protein
VLAYNLMMLAIVAGCLAAIHFAFEERQRRQVKRCLANLIASILSRSRRSLRQLPTVISIQPQLDGMSQPALYPSHQQRGCCHFDKR